MKEITVISGKGGTGKTSLTGSFAALARKSAVLVDADVDAANLSLITRPTLRETYEFRASREAVIDPERCRRCGLCFALCRFGAVSEDYAVDSTACEGCGVCVHACPHEAAVLAEKLSGHWFISDTPYGTLVHARLGVAEENSGKLVTTIRNKAVELASAAGKEYLIIDGPPGIGCPVIASLAGVKAALIVTEPTLSGIHDLERVLAVCRHFSVAAAVCINRFDLDERNTRAIEEYCEQAAVMLAGKIPFDRAVVEAVVRGIPVVEYTQGPVSGMIKEVWARTAAMAE
ncbi:MAG: ATP-binding protein [Bacillota bacterium]